jgi:hypothetical protein
MVEMMQDYTFNVNTITFMDKEGEEVNSAKYPLPMGEINYFYFCLPPTKSHVGQGSCSMAHVSCLFGNI